jgi:hypothetical protein
MGWNFSIGLTEWSLAGRDQAPFAVVMVAIGLCGNHSLGWVFRLTALRPPLFAAEQAAKPAYIR